MRRTDGLALSAAVVFRFDTLLYMADDCEAARDTGDNFPECAAYKVNARTRKKLIPALVGARILLGDDTTETNGQTCSHIRGGR